MEVNTIKIKIKPTVTFRYKGRFYPRDAIVEIDPKYFDATFMVKVEEPKPQPIETVIKEVVTATPQEPVFPKLEELPSPIEEKPKPKPRRVQKKDAD